MQTVKRERLQTIPMVEGGEKTHPIVIDDGKVKEWVGFGWITTGPATDEDRDKFPVVID